MSELKVIKIELNKPEALFSDLEIMGRLKHEIDVVERRERHHKYKRCLAMAKMCTELAERYQAEYNAEEGFGDGWLKWIRWARKWHNRWLDIAEKFKEVR